jgi:transcription elongation factor GreA
MKEAYLTREGLNELRDKLKVLKTNRRREIAEAIHAAKEQGDLSENAEYQNAKEEQHRVEEQIANIEGTIKNARLITDTSTEQVDVGNTVLLDCGGMERAFRIVGSNEADPLKGKISNESPMGQALLRKKPGETASIPAPGGQKNCTIIKIGN